MMRPLLCGLLLLWHSSLSAQLATYIEVPRGWPVMAAIHNNDRYAQPSFVQGTINYKNGRTTDALLNYDRLLGEVQTINGRDTVAVDKPSVHYVAFASDTFVRVFTASAVPAPVFYKVEKDYGKMRLVSQALFAFVEKKPVAGDSSRVNLNLLPLTNARFLKNIAPAETLTLALYNRYQLLNVKDELLPVHRSTLFQLYPHREKAVLAYLQQRVVPTNDKEKILALLDFTTQANVNNK